MVLLRLGVRGIGLISTLILVRLLVPADFGIVAMAMSIFAAIDLLTAFSFDVALIQKQDAGKDEYNAAWSLNVLLGGAATVVLLLVAFPAAGFYEDPRLAPIILVLAVCALLQGLENIGLVDFRKHLEFQKEFIFRFAVKAASFIVTVSLAFAYRSYWALIAGIVTGKVAGLIFSYIIHPFRPKLCLKGVHHIIHFSKWLFLSNLAQFVRFRSSDFILGKISGAASLGLFSIAYEISSLPTTELIAPINRALLPGFSKITSDRGRMSRSLAQAAATLALVSLPAGVGIAATAELLVPVLLGERWLPAVPLIEILALLGALNAVLSPIGTAMLAAGRPAVFALLSLCLIVVMIPTSVYFTQIEGPLGMAKALFGTTLLFTPITYGVGARILGLTWADIVRIFARPILAAAIMYFVVSSFVELSITLETLPDVFSLLVSVALGAAVYASAIAGAWLALGRPDGPERYLLSSFGYMRRLAFAKRLKRSDTG